MQTTCVSSSSVDPALWSKRQMFRFLNPLIPLQCLQERWYTLDVCIMGSYGGKMHCRMDKSTRMTGIKGSETLTESHVLILPFFPFLFFLLLHLTNVKLYNTEWRRSGGARWINKRTRLGYASKTIKWDLNLLKWDGWKRQQHIVWSDMSSAHFN